MSLNYSSFSNHQMLCFSYDWAQNDCFQVGRPASDPVNITPGPLTAGEADGGDVDEIVAVGRTGTLDLARVVKTAVVERAPVVCHH